MTETKNGLWIIYSLEERPFNVFVVHERCESIIICFVILSISDDFDHKKIRLPMYHLGRVWKVRSFFVKSWQSLGSLRYASLLHIWFTRKKGNCLFTKNWMISLHYCSIYYLVTIGFIKNNGVQFTIFNQVCALDQIRCSITFHKA